MTALCLFVICTFFCRIAAQCKRVACPCMLVGLLCGRVVVEEDDVLQLLWSAIRLTSSQALYHFYSDLDQAQHRG